MVFRQATNIPNDKLIATLNVFRISLTSSNLLIVCETTIYFDHCQFAIEQQIKINNISGSGHPAANRHKKTTQPGEGLDGLLGLHQAKLEGRHSQAGAWERDTRVTD